MTLDAVALQKLLCQHLCEEVRVIQRTDGELMLDTHFCFPDGDSFPIHLSEVGHGRLQLSDSGDTLMRISYEHDVNSFFEGKRGLLLEHIVSESGVEWEGGALTVKTEPEGLPEAIFRFGQALTRVYDLTLPSRVSKPNAASTFYTDLAELVFRCVDRGIVKPDFRPKVPHAESYHVDYRVDGSNERPLFLYGVPNQDKARLTAVMLSHFHRHALRFASLAIFRDESKIPLADRTRLSDAGCTSIPSLVSEAEFQAKLERLLGPHGTEPANGRTFQATFGD